MEATSKRGVWKAVRATAAHTLLLAFTILLVLKLVSSSCSWWFVFSPLWLFHAVVAHGRFSIPAATHQYHIRWDPFHSFVAMPLLIAFELLLCVYIENSYVNKVAAVNLKIVFIPVFLLEAIIIVENIRAFFLDMEILARLPEWDEDDEVVVMTSHFYGPTVSMICILAATVCMVLIINGDMVAVSLWVPYVLFSAGQLFAYIVSFGSMRMRASVVRVEEDQSRFRVCIGDHVVVVLIAGFEILLFMYVQGTPARARKIPIPIIFSPLFLLQGIGVLFSTSQLVERVVALLLQNEAGDRRNLTLTARACDYLEVVCHGSRFLGWWSIDDGSREAEGRSLHECESGSSPPDVVKKMTEKDLVEEVFTLQAAINEEIQLTGYLQREYDLLRNDKVLCRICFQWDIGVVLLPCRHRILCSTCGKKCSTCPICHVSIAKRMNIS